MYCVPQHLGNFIQILLYDSARDILVIKDPIVYDVLCQQTEDNEN